MRRRSGPRIAILVAILTLVTAGVGLVATLILNAFVFDEFDAYGEVPIPGTASLHLPGRGDRQLSHDGHGQPVEWISDSRSAVLDHSARGCSETPSDRKCRRHNHSEQRH